MTETEFHESRKGDPEFSLEGRWNVIKPQLPLSISRGQLILALQYAIRQRSRDELTTVGHERESNLLKAWQHMLAIVERDARVEIR